MNISQQTMKNSGLSLGFVSICSSLFGLALALPAGATCVQSHTGVQLHMGQQPAQQTNNVDQKINGACNGSTSASTSTQVSVGRGRTQQQQNVRQEINGDRSTSSKSQGPNFQGSVVVPVNVKTPDHFNP